MQTTLQLLTLLLLMQTQIHAQPDGWNNIGGNPQKNGYADVAGPDTDSVLWESLSPGIFGTPIFIEGNYLVTMRFQSLTNAPVECYNLSNGSLLWSVDVTNGAGRSLPIGLRDNRVYVVRFTESLNDSLFALNVSNGSRIWTSNATVATYISESGVFDAAGNFYVNGNFKTYKINPANGQIIWQTPTVPMASGSGEMAINPQNNTGYTLEQNGGISYVWAINLSTGAKLYSVMIPDLRPGGNLPQSALMVGNNGTIYVQLTEDNVAAVSDNGSQLNLLWQTEIYGNSAFSTMCVGTDGSVYAPSNRKIIRIDPTSGSITDSSANISQGGFFSPRLSATNNQIIYATNGENQVYAFDPSLNLIWTGFMNYTNTSGVSFSETGLAAISGGNSIRVYTPRVTTGARPRAESGISVYPNPAEDFLIIESPNDSQNHTYSLYNIEGKEIRNGSIHGKTILPLHTDPPGIYLLKLSNHPRPFKITKQ